MKGLRSISAKYIIISMTVLFCIAIYVNAGYLFTQHLKNEQRIIKKIGEERMLSLSMAFHALLIIDLPSSREEATLKKKALEAMNEYETILYGLRSGSDQSDFTPIHLSDAESVAHLDTLIRNWESGQKVTMLKLLEMPQSEKRRACDICHSAVRENLRIIEDLMGARERNYEAEIERFENARMFILGFFFLIGAAIFLYVRKSMVMPVIGLRNAASRFKTGDFSARVDYSSRDEIGELSECFNQMAESLEKAFSENRELLSSLNDAKMTAEAASKAKSEFLANVSHELRTPLTAVIGFSEIMIDGVTGPVTTEQKEYLSNIMDSGQHLLDLINDILDLSKIEAGKMELELSDFDMKELIERSIIMFKEKIFKHGIDVNIQIDEGVGTINADERKIKQVVFNLLSNAVKFTPDGGKITISAQVVTGGPPGLRFSIEDSGPGIRDEDNVKLFRPFEQLYSGLTKPHEGTGLGLALCKRMIDLHGGTIWVESEYGKGSRFLFIIPAGR